MSFTGIPLAALDFYEELEADNSKTFWTANKHRYDSQVKVPLTALAEELEPEFGAGKLFRPYRDVRFSADKTPYKTRQGIWFDQAAVYVHVSAAGLFLAAGHWQYVPQHVDRYRRAVDDERTGAALQKVVDKLRMGGWEIGGDRLVRVPAGYAKDHPRVELLKHKTLTAHRELGAPEWLSTPDAAREIAARWKELAPLTGWLADHMR